MDNGYTRLAAACPGRCREGKVSNDGVQGNFLAVRCCSGVAGVSSILEDEEAKLF